MFLSSSASNYVFVDPKGGQILTSGELMSHDFGPRRHRGWGVDAPPPPVSFSEMIPEALGASR